MDKSQPHVRQAIMEAVRPYASKFIKLGEEQRLLSFEETNNLIIECADDILGDLKRHDRSVQSQIDCAINQAVEKAKAECLSQYENELAHLNNVIQSLEGQLKNARLVDPTNKTIGILEAKLSTSNKANKALMANIESLTKTIREII